MDVTDEKFPDRMFRGISSKKYIMDGTLTDEVFPLIDYRDDGYYEISVTWDDDESALGIIMAQRSERHNGEIQFKGGIAEIDRHEMRFHLKTHFLNERLNYERKATKNNPFHGNILIKKDIGKQMQRIIRCALATLANGKIYENAYVKNDEGE